MMFIDNSGRRRKIKKPYNYKIDWEGSSRSKLQKKAKDFLRNYWEGHLVYEEFPMVGSRMTFDFFNASQSIIIEVDGNQHIKYNDFFHKGNHQNFLNQIKRDEAKEIFCIKNNLILFRVSEQEDIIRALKEFLDN